MLTPEEKFENYAKPTDKPSGGDDPWVSACCGACIPKVDNATPFNPRCLTCGFNGRIIRRSTRDAIKAEGAREERQQFDRIAHDLCDNYEGAAAEGIWRAIATRAVQIQQEADDA